MHLYFYYILEFLSPVILVGYLTILAFKLLRKPKKKPSTNLTNFIFLEKEILECNNLTHVDQNIIQNNINFTPILLDIMNNSINKWQTDYFVLCHIKDNIANPIYQFEIRNPTIFPQVLENNVLKYISSVFFINSKNGNIIRKENGFLMLYKEAFKEGFMSLRVVINKGKKNLDITMQCSINFIDHYNKFEECMKSFKQPELLKIFNKPFE